MYSELECPLTDTQRERLAACITDAEQRAVPDARCLVTTVVWAMACVFLFIACAWVVTRWPVHDVSAWFMVAVGFGAPVCAVVACLSLRTHFDRRREARHIREVLLPRMHALLLSGRRVIRRIQATAVLRIEANEDEGDAFAFDLGDGRVFWVRWQDYLPEPDAAPWPNTDFEIASDHLGSILHCHGAALEPSVVLPPCSWPGEWAAADGCLIIPANLDTVRRRLLCE